MPRRSARSLEPVLAHSKYTARLIPTRKPTKAASLDQFRKRQARAGEKNAEARSARRGNRRRPATASRVPSRVPSRVSERIRANYGRAKRHPQPAGTGVLFNPRDCIGPRYDSSPSESPVPAARSRPATAKDRNIFRKKAAGETDAAAEAEVPRPGFHASTYVGKEHPSHVHLKKFQVPARAGLHLPEVYRAYDLQGRRVDRDNGSGDSAKTKTNKMSDVSDGGAALKVRGGPKAEDLHPLPGKWPEIGDMVRIAPCFLENGRCPSTGWVRVAPGEVGEVTDTGHVMVTAQFPSLF